MTDRSPGPTIGRTLAESTPSVRQSARVGEGAPNVIVIVFDDLGFSDFGCFGSEIATPNIDRLAGGGLRYNSFHVTALCSPTRACLMTGRNQHAVGMGFLANLSRGFPGYSGRIPKSAGMLPRVLRDGGYSTFAVGKWHLAPHSETGPAGPFDRWPLGMGFERYYGFLNGMTNQWRPGLVRDNSHIDPPSTPEEGYHLSDDLVSQAIRFLHDQQHAGPSKPFFLYLAFGATHWPHHVAREWAEPYRGRFDEGWEAIREQRYERQREHGVIPETAKLTPRPSWVAPWAEIEAAEQRLYARMMEVYAGFLTHTDAQIGRLMEYLSGRGVLGDTLVMLVSDNGASADGGPHGFLDHSVREVAEMVARTEEFGGHGAFNHYAWGWAWAGNTPFRLWKKYSWLGGVRVPLIVHWPARIPAHEHGAVRGQFSHAIDLMPTILEATGVEAAAAIDGVSQQPLDGRSMLATFDAADSATPRRTQYFETVGSRSIYHDGWKATTDHVDPAERELIDGSPDLDTDRWSLFRLEDDFSEAEDISEVHPERVRHLVELWWSEAGRNQVLPLINGFAEAFSDRWAEVSPTPERYVYLPGGGPIITPSPFHDFDLVAEVEVETGTDSSGVVCAHRNRLEAHDMRGGWSCYLVDGRPIVAVADTRGRQTRILAETTLSGMHELGVSCRANGVNVSFTLTLDGREAGTCSVVADDPILTLHSGRLLFGRDTGIAISDEYEPPFPFRGHIHRGVITICPPPPTNQRERIESGLKHD